MPDPAFEREVIALFERLLDTPPEGHEAFLDEHTAERPEVRARLLSMLAAHRDAALNTGGAAHALEEEPPPERIGAYRIAGQIGRGGMGTVYRGERASGDFEHIVAIKIVKPGLLSEALVERFQRERQILANLSHPHIARLYDGGETPGGSPYIVMEYVDGEPLLRWVEEHKPARAQRQQLFLDIGAAVAFAHRNLIIHRDLTPSNVLVTRDGVVKLIDFGIARPAEVALAEDGPAAQSLAGLTLTPGYAAPERLTGAVVTTAADVYSLGRLFLDLIQPGPKEREARAIADKATALLPADRYETVEAMLQDVRAWRDGFPVAAMNGGAAYVAKRLVTRRPLMVSASALGLALLITAFGVTLVANVRAEEARAEAQKRFDETRAIAKTMIFDAYSEVSAVQGSTKAREVLATAGLKYLDALASDPRAPADVKLEAGLGYLRLAEVIGGGQSSHLGKLADAAALLVKGEKLVREAHAADPKNADAAQALAELLIQQSGDNLYNTNDIALARKQALEAQALLKPFAASDAYHARFYVTAIQAEGDSYGWDEDFPKAVEAHKRAEDFVQSVSPEIRDETAFLRARSANLRLLGDAYKEMKQYEPAFKAMDEAVKINREFLRRSPDSPVARRSVAVSLYSRAVVERSMMRDAAAATSIAEAVALARGLRERDPSNAGARDLFAIVAEIQAQVMADTGHSAESYALGQEVIAAHRETIRLSDNLPGPRRTLAAALVTHGGNSYNGGEYGRACAAWQEALSIYQMLDKAGDLTAHDRSEGLSKSTEYVAKACRPPRAGLPNGPE